MSKTKKQVKPDVVEESTERQITDAQLKELGKLPTMSAKIRYLDKEGFPRNRISRDFDLKTKDGKPIRYQHVRNVLETPLKRRVGKVG